MKNDAPTAAVLRAQRYTWLANSDDASKRLQKNSRRCPGGKSTLGARSSERIDAGRPARRGRRGLGRARRRWLAGTAAMVVMVMDLSGRLAGAGLLGGGSGLSGCACLGRSGGLSRRGGLCRSRRQGLLRKLLGNPCRA